MQSQFDIIIEQSYSIKELTKRIKNLEEKIDDFIKDAPKEPKEMPGFGAPYGSDVDNFIRIIEDQAETIMKLNNIIHELKAKLDFPSKSGGLAHMRDEMMSILDDLEYAPNKRPGRAEGAAGPRMVGSWMLRPGQALDPGQMLRPCRQGYVCCPKTGAWVKKDEA